jgi:transcriptional regulator with XRE-family HTH domain
MNEVSRVKAILGHYASMQKQLVETAMSQEGMTFSELERRSGIFRHRWSMWLRGTVTMSRDNLLQVAKLVEEWRAEGLLS